MVSFSRGSPETDGIATAHPFATEQEASDFNKDMAAIYTHDTRH